jgi:para-aminobenzoate synthetase
MLFGDDAAAFWLDSSQITSTPSRFSFMGGSAGGTIQYFSQDRRLLLRGNDQRIEFCESIFSFLNRWIAERPCQTAPLPFNFQGGFVGYFGYELKGECGASYAHRSTLPDCCLVYADRYLVFDHVERELYLVYIGDSESDAEAQTWFNDIEHKLSVPQMSSCGQSLVVREHVSFVSDLSRAQYLRSVGRCLDWIAQGETYEICLTTQLRGRTSVDPFEYYRTLRRLNPAPYSAFLKMYGFAVACSSPESFLNVQANRIVVSKPIKGTIRRSNDTTKDVEFRETLRNDMKSQSENLMIVDLIRNDLGRVCDVGSVSVPRLMGIESFATVHQMVSTISGVLRSDRSAVDCLRCSFPGGSMTGAPKIRTMNLIDELEPRSRGVYSGAIGYVSLDGAADLNIVIRTAVFQANDVSIGTGGAIVALSSASAELDELLLKSQPLLDAFAALTGRVSLKIE